VKRPKGPVRGVNVLAANVFTTLRLAMDDSAMTPDAIRKCTKVTIRRNRNDILSIKMNENYGVFTSMTSISILCPQLFLVDTTFWRTPPGWTDEDENDD
jgi:hypothetical protein